MPPGRYRPQFLGLHDLAASHDSVIEIGKDTREVRFDVRLVPGKMLHLGNGHHRIVASDGTVLWDCEGLTSVDLPYGIYEIDGQRREVSR